MRVLAFAASHLIPGRVELLLSRPEFGFERQRCHGLADS
jgi:hypothetical protein